MEQEKLFQQSYFEQAFKRQFRNILPLNLWDLESGFHIWVYWDE